MTTRPIRSPAGPSAGASRRSTSPHRLGLVDAETAAALRASGAWLRTMFAIAPLAVGVRVDDSHRLGHEIAQVANQFADPYQVPDTNFGWSARDARHAYGSFVLEHDEALVITHRRRSAGSGIWWCGTCSWPPTTSTTRAVR